jgi:hypothetical protein
MKDIGSLSHTKWECKDEAMVREYIRYQEKEDQRVDQLSFFKE